MSQDDDGRLLLACIFGFGAGIYMFFKGFREFREFRLVADTPEIPIRSVPMGLVHIRGQARSEETLHSPVTHTPCYLYKVVVEEWHSESRGGGEWKHVATDLQSVKFDLQDASGNVLVDATNAELDLPCGAKREVRGSGAAPSLSRSPIAPGAPQTTRPPAADAEILQYVEQARLRHFTQVVGRGIGALTHANDPTHQSQRPPLLDLLADPAGAGAAAFQAQMIRAMLTKHDPSGQTTRAALEVWKHPQGTPEFQAAFATFAQNGARAMSMGKPGFDPSSALAQAQQHPEQALRMVALVAGAAEPQSDPEAERARQAALAYGRDHSALTRHQTPTASGHYRLTEYCLLPDQTYDLTGTCTENPNPRDEYDRNIIVKGSNEPTFLISSRTEKQVESWLRKRAAGKVFGGAALSVVCLAIILWKAGLF